MSGVQKGRARLGRRWRQAVLLVHVVASIGWMGVDIALVPLAVTGLTTGDGQLAAACYRAISVLVPWSTPFLAVAMTATGLVLGWGTQWGLVRYWWVFTKLVIALVLTTLVFVLLLPAVSGAESIAPLASGDQVRAALGAFPVQVMFPVAVSFTALAVASVLAVVKPWGRTPWTGGGGPARR